MTGDKLHRRKETNEVTKMKFKDYALILKDSTGKTYAVSINGECINEQIRIGASESQAVEGVEQNACANAIYRGDIGADCWVESVEQ
jgi:hypothetical protein